MLQNFPASYLIACAIFTLFFLLTFSIARNPRGWRRLYQSRFTRPEDISVNRNKRLDETLARYGIVIAMLFFVADVGCLLLGLTLKHRHTLEVMTKGEKFRDKELEDRFR